MQWSDNVDLDSTIVRFWMQLTEGGFGDVLWRRNFSYGSSETFRRLSNSSALCVSVFLFLVF